MRLLSFMGGGLLSGFLFQASVMSTGDTLYPPETPREYLLVDTAPNRAAVERAEREERLRLQAESENARLMVEVAVLRERLKLAVPDGIEAQGETIPPQSLPVLGGQP